MYSLNKDNKGFSTIELIIVILIIGIMSTFTFITLRAQNLTTASKIADQVMAQINTLYSDSLYMQDAYGCICGNESGVWLERYGKEIGHWDFNEEAEIKVEVPKSATATTLVNLRETQTYQSIFGETYANFESKIGSLWYADKKWTYNAGRTVIVNRPETFALELRANSTAIYLDYYNHKYTGPSEIIITYKGETSSVFINAFGKAYR